MIEAVGPPVLREPQPDAFAALVRSIVFQQLAGRAASAIHQRFLATLPNGLSPQNVLTLPPEVLREAGLSGAKAASILDLATKVGDGTVPLEDAEALADEDLITRLATVRGIGRWTAEMFLIFHLRRPDVWPVDDLGVRKGYAKAHGLALPPPPRALMALGDLYRPWRTVAAWYCWRAVDTVLPEA
ncbi:hypothetical protein [Candidatus Dormiibacter inghamiae]|uniref:DNA-3-methyladenine glycosylase family protein n=1 Tax=Candidatus Dormiibacter inghamiae TaxID=3127013 RepID=UPI0030C69908